jgi:hypothetical protein
MTQHRRPDQICGIFVIPGWSKAQTSDVQLRIGEFRVRATRWRDPERRFAYPLACARSANKKRGPLARAFFIGAVLS